MKNNRPIQIFEHTSLRIGECGFEKCHWEALGWYNESHGGRFFSLTPKGVKFKQYVGVIQVGDLSIEILPKISKTSSEDDKAKWQKVLIDMLRECSWMQVYSHEKASLRFKPNSILEAYIELFVNECDRILRQGLVKKYRRIDSNCSALKGKLLFAKQIQANLVHKERFFTQHQIFDNQNIFNQILYKALKLTPLLSQSPYLKDKIYNLLLHFPELEDILVDNETFSHLIYDRKTTRYKEAVEIAAMLLLNYRPDIRSGQNHVLAILFDMNDLWEEYIFRQLYKNKPLTWSIKSQNSKGFWKLNTSVRYKTVRPDIVIHDRSSNLKIILDTKWKVPENNIPADGDLKQMFVYNEYWQGKHAVLVYPNVSYTSTPVYHEGTFANKPNVIQTHKCGVMKMAVLDSADNNLDNTIGIRINEFLKDKILNES